ncbi:MAG: metallophosphoesterase family protein, partial [Oscillospiraceae bacterium]|nr:metallophosphoesterase family protein [Oscillospiraceae bacterium]
LGVKSSLIRAYYTAQEKAADILLHGHTHMPYIDERGGIWMMNPGSIGDYRRPSYGLLAIEGDKILPSLYVL